MSGAGPSPQRGHTGSDGTLRGVLTSLRLRALITILLAALGLSLGLAGPAQAHDQLLKSEPGADATVSSADQITLTYNNEILPTGARVKVDGPDGSAATSGELEVDGKIVTQKIDAKAAGAYTVTWRVTSSDGHPISGKFSFTLKAAGESSASTSSSSAPQSDGADRTTQSGQWNQQSASATADGGSEGTSEPTMAPSQRVGTDETRNQPWVIIGLAVLAAAGIVGAGIFARKRVRDDE